jgi:hypothetical protein
VPIALLLSRPLIEHLPIGFEWVGKPSMLALSPMEDLLVDFRRVVVSSRLHPTKARLTLRNKDCVKISNFSYLSRPIV